MPREVKQGRRASEEAGPTAIVAAVPDGARGGARPSPGAVGDGPSQANRRSLSARWFARRSEHEAPRAASSRAAAVSGSCSSSARPWRRP